MRPKSLEPEISNVPNQLEIGDLRFRKLLGQQAWSRLPIAVQKRFSKRLIAGETVVYVGTIDQVEISKMGKVLATLLRLVGAPLPLHRETGVAFVVTVTEDTKTGGQNWSRLYASRNNFPQIIQSSKRFAGSTGLEEYIGFGIAMALKVRATQTALIFESAGFYLQLGQWRVPFPALLSPGLVTVTHEEVTPERFRFSLELTHPIYGKLIEQSGLFSEQR